jgi:hypothetical protein
MAAYVKFDPWAYLNAKPETLAGFATLAAPPAKTENAEGSPGPWNKNQKRTGLPAKVAKVAKAGKVHTPFPFAAVLNALEARCPDHIAAECWQQCLIDARQFLAAWGDQARALGWTAAELFGLHTPPGKPHPSYDRLSRYDATGLLWHLAGNRVVALTAETAAIENKTTGNVLIYRKLRKPALGPLGDSLDDFTA